MSRAILKGERLRLVFGFIPAHSGQRMSEPDVRLGAWEEYNARPGTFCLQMTMDTPDNDIPVVERSDRIFPPKDRTRLLGQYQVQQLSKAVARWCEERQCSYVSVNPAFRFEQKVRRPIGEREFIHHFPRQAAAEAKALVQFERYYHHILANL